MKFPETRLRRLRYNNKVRNLVENVSLSISDLIYPIFVCEGNNTKNEIKSLPGQYQLSIDNVLVLCEDLKKSGIQNIIIFGISSEKDETGEISCNQKSIVPMAIKEINALASKSKPYVIFTSPSAFDAFSEIYDPNNFFLISIEQIFLI